MINGVLTNINNWIVKLYFLRITKQKRKRQKKTERKQAQKEIQKGKTPCIYARQIAWNYLQSLEQCSSIIGHTDKKKLKETQPTTTVALVQPDSLKPPTLPKKRPLNRYNRACRPPYGPIALWKTNIARFLIHNIDQPLQFNAY